MPRGNRRAFVTGASAALAGGAAAAARAEQPDKPLKRVLWPGGKRPEKTPLFSPAVQWGALIFLSGIGAHFEGDIKAPHTAHVLDEMNKKLEEAGSSMEGREGERLPERPRGHQAMNEGSLGRFGSEPPVGTTIAAAGGIAGGSRVEIDSIASA